MLLDSDGGILSFLTKNKDLIVLDLHLYIFVHLTKLMIEFLFSTMKYFIISSIFLSSMICHISSQDDSSLNNYVEILLLSPISDISVSVLFLFSLNVFSIILDSSGMLKGSKVVGYKITNLKRGWLLIVICYFNFLV